MIYEFRLLSIGFQNLVGFLTFERGSMEDNLDLKLQGMQLTEEEEEIIVCEEEEDDTISEQLMLCLVGKLLTSNPFSVEAMKNTMRAAWRLSKGMVVREIDSKVFIFQFFSLADKQKVMEDGLWTFDGAPLILKEVEEGIQPSELVFDTVRIWVKAEDVPLNKRTKAMAVTIAKSLGSFVEYDENDPIGWSKYMRFRVDLRLDKPLRRGMRIGVQQGSKWIKLKYEKLIDFCFACGLLGHNYQQCLGYDGLSPVEKLPYGKGLRGSPTKRRRFVDSRRDEEIAMCNEFKGSLRMSKARAKLTYKMEMEDLGAGGSKKGAMTVYTNPMANSIVEAAREEYTGERSQLDEMDSRERFLKRGRKDPIVVGTQTAGAKHGPIYDTPMVDNSGNDNPSSFSLLNGGRRTDTIPDLSAVIGDDQSRRLQ